MPIFPPQASSALQLSDYSGYVSCGNSTLLSFGGTKPYTIAAWVNYAPFPATSSSYTIVSRYTYTGNTNNYQEYTLAIQKGGTVIAARDTQTPNSLVKSSFTLAPQTWNHVAMSYDGTTLFLYLNGVFAGSKVLGPMTTAPKASTLIGAQMVSGGPNNVYLGRIGIVRFWNACLSLDDIVDASVQIDVEDLPHPHQIAYFDFATIPATDRSSNGFPLQFVGNAAYTQDVPGLQLAVESWGDCGSPDTLSFSGQKPYTIEGWFVPQSNNSHLISKFATSDLPRSQYLVGIDASGRLYARRGATTVTSRISLAFSQHYHFATTFDGTVLKLYINGNLQAGSSSPNSLPENQLEVFLGTTYSASLSESVTEPAESSEVEPDNEARLLAATAPIFLQNLRVWDVALSEDVIRQWMYNNPGVSEGDLVASFDFTGTVPTDNTNLNTLQLYGQAALTTLPLIVPSTSADGQIGFIQPLVDQVLGVIGHLHLAQIPLPNVTPGPQLVPFSTDHLESLKAGTPHSAHQIEAAFHRAEALITAHPHLKEGITKHHEDGLVTLIHHTTNGSFEVFSAPEAQISDCTLWWISFVYMLTVGFLGALGLIPTPGGAIGGRIWAFISRNRAALTTIEGLLTGTITLTAAIRVVKALYDYGLLWPIIRMALTSAGWYALFWVLRKVIAILTGLEAAEILAGFIVWVGQLIYQATQYSRSCSTLPEGIPEIAPVQET